MAVIRILLVAAVTGGALLVGCQDDPEKALSEAGISKMQLAQSRQEPASLPAPAAPAESGRNSELPGGLGRYEVVHDPTRARVEIRFPDASPGSGRVQNAALWLAGPDGPVSLAVEPCSAGSARCLAARSELLKTPVLQGILRCEVDGQRYRIPLQTHRPETQPASEKSTPTQPEPTR